MKTVEKVALDEIRTKRVFDQPCPPLDRLAASGAVGQPFIDALFHQRDRIDVMALRNRIDKNILDLWKVKPSSAPVNIYNTLRKEMGTSVSFSFEPSNLFT
jgi:hypothetical protein